MAYSKGSKVAALDFNSIVGFDPTTTSDTFNSVWGTGSGALGYGQPPISTVSEGGTIAATNWSQLRSAALFAASHQGTAAALAPNPIIGSIVTQDPALFPLIQNLYANKMNAVVQGTTVPTTTTNLVTWTDRLVFEHVITFSSGDDARYFFNMGGQLSLTFSAPSGYGINQLLSKLSMDCGTIVISAPNTEQAKIAGVTYDGVTKIGGTSAEAIGTRYSAYIDNAHKLVPELGYHGLGPSYQEIFRQTVGGFPSRYTEYEGSFISISAKTNGSQGLHGDNGNIITIQTVWEQVPNGLQVLSGTTTTLTVKPPFLGAGLTKSWGTPVVTGAVTGN